MNAVSAAERAILRALAEGMPEGPEPYAQIARQAGTTEDEALELIRGLVARGMIRRVAAIVHDAKLGYEGNAMVAWRLPEPALARAGELAASSPAVSHAYARRTAPEWPFNLYTMVHARSRDDAEAIVRGLARTIGCADYRMLYTVREFTKRPPDYRVLWSEGRRT